MELKQLEAKNDHRGTLVEAFHFPHDGQVFYILAKAGSTRGNHYHTRKTEQFLVIQGSATMEVRDRETENVMRAVITAAQPMLITIAPNHTHSITAGPEGAVIIAWVDERLDPDNPDTFQEEV